MLALATERGEAGVPWPETIEAALTSRDVAPPVLASFTPELHSYDALIAEVSA